MAFVKCPECGCELTKEMLDVNMCWECGRILDESLVDNNTLSEIEEQSREINPFNNPKIKMHKLTTGYNFERCNIIKYNGVVSGETVIGTGFLSDFKAGISDFFGGESKVYSNKLKEAKQAAMYDMIIESVKLGGNAVIGIAYNYVMFTGNMIGISVTGTSVLIEENDLYDK